MHAPQVILLDLDGTLVDASEAIVDGVLALASRHGLQVPERSWAAGRIGCDPVETWALLGADDPAGMVERFTRQILPTLPGRTRVLPGVPAALARLRAMDIHLAVATTRLTASARESLAHAGLADAIAQVSGRDLVPRTKPAPDVLLHALEALGARPEQALMVGDSEADVQAAHAAGMPCFAVLGGIGDERALRAAGADLILAEGLAGLPAALQASAAAGPPTSEPP